MLGGIYPEHMVITLSVDILTAIAFKLVFNLTWIYFLLLTMIETTTPYAS